MAGFIKISVEKLPTQSINTKINSEIFAKFQKRCKQNNIPMNVVMETFCRQYANSKYYLDEEQILKWKDNTDNTSILNTPINKDIYYQFKDKVKADGYFVKYVLTAFIEDYAKQDMVFELVNTNDN